MVFLHLLGFLILVFFSSQMYSFHLNHINDILFLISSSTISLFGKQFIGYVNFVYWNAIVVYSFHFFIYSLKFSVFSCYLHKSLTFPSLFSFHLLHLLISLYFSMMSKRHDEWEYTCLVLDLSEKVSIKYYIGFRCFTLILIEVEDFFYS